MKLFLQISLILFGFQAATEEILGAWMSVYDAVNSSSECAKTTTQKGKKGMGEFNIYHHLHNAVSSHTYYLLL